MEDIKDMKEMKGMKKSKLKDALKKSIMGFKISILISPMDEMDDEIEDEDNEKKEKPEPTKLGEELKKNINPFKKKKKMNMD